METMLRGLLTGNFRRWGATQYRQYHSVLGRYKRLGIELEANSIVSREPLEAEGFKISWIKPGSKCTCPACQVAYRESMEITYLFDVTDPKVLYNTVRNKILFLHKQRFGTTGSLHLNYQWKNTEKRHPLTLRMYRCTDDGIVEDPTLPFYSTRRIEVKTGVGFIHFEDLLLQMVCTGQRLLNPDKFEDFWNLATACRPHLLMPISKRTVEEWMNHHKEAANEQALEAPDIFVIQDPNVSGSSGFEEAFLEMLNRSSLASSSEAGGVRPNSAARR